MPVPGIRLAESLGTGLGGFALDHMISGHSKRWIRELGFPDFSTTLDLSSEIVSCDREHMHLRRRWLSKSLGSPLLEKTLSRGWRDANRQRVPETYACA